MAYDQEKIIEAIEKVLTDVGRERLRQIELWGNQEDLNWGQWLAILAEEFGEAAQALQPLMGITTVKKTDADDVYKELIQLSAVSGKMAELVAELLKG